MKAKILMLLLFASIFSGCKSQKPVISEEHTSGNGHICSAKTENIDISRLCIYGYVFIEDTVFRGGGIVQFLGDDGKPLKCECRDDDE
ncbi:hypothetical protein [Campylobacter curvus]|uniref:hypothetical protein n=1 Tax=Campylobacter curvus TaxID=200 RepID=UPI00146FCD21|nr:hypothetical protein [Campylobacter curvus]